MAELNRPKPNNHHTSRCTKSKTRQVNIKMSDELKNACQDKAAELGISFTELLAEGAIHMLDSNHTERQRVSIMIQNQEKITKAFSILDSFSPSPKTEALRSTLFEILKGEESAWRL